MPLLMCPNCEAGMKQIKRETVEIDMCPECKGVWLDRGELEKLLDIVEPESMPAKAQQQQATPPQGQPYYPPQGQPYDPYYGGGHHGGGGLRRFFGGHH